MTPKEKALEYFNVGRVMQIATMHEGSPRPLSVYYVVSDEGTSVYWMSEPRRRHSDDIMKNPRVGGAIAIKLDQPVIGLQFVGHASTVPLGSELKGVIDKYNKKYADVANGLFERIQNGTNKHLIYKLSIESLELFDGVNFPEGGNTVKIPLS